MFFHSPDDLFFFSVFSHLHQSHLESQVFATCVGTLSSTLCSHIFNLFFGQRPSICAQHFPPLFLPRFSHPSWPGVSKTLFFLLYPFLHIVQPLRRLEKSFRSVVQWSATVAATQLVLHDPKYTCEVPFMCTDLNALLVCSNF